jgi:hypothetical protein
MAEDIFILVSTEYTPEGNVVFRIQEFRKDHHQLA